MKSVIRSAVIAFATLAAVSVSVSVARANPDRPTHEGDTGPGPADSTPGDGGGHGSWSNPERPSRDNDHSSDSSGGYDTGAGYDSNGVWSYGGCAPSDIQSNVAATDKTLKALVATPAFAKATEFKSTVAQIAAMKNPAARGDAYMKLAGINTKNSADVLAFVGARDAKGTWIVELERNGKLNEQQAETVAGSLQSALRGGLN
jgi:hypothetical protein